MRIAGAAAALALALGLAQATWGAQEQGFDGGPREGKPAPVFTLNDLGGREFRLEEYREKSAVVLVTGSHSCPIFRKTAPALERLYQRYNGRAEFFVLYTVEAHPVGSPSPYSDEEWVTDENRAEGVLLPQPSSYAERATLASRSARELGFSLPVLVDRMENRVWQEYGEAPNAAYLIDYEGNVRLRQDWFDPAALEKALVETLLEEPPNWQ